MDVQLPFYDEHHRALYTKVKQLCDDRLAALASMEVEDIGNSVVDYIALLGQEGLFDPALGKALEGEAPRPDLRALCIVRYLLSQASGLCDGVFGAQVLGLYPVALCGNDDQRAIFLPAMASGQALVSAAILDAEEPAVVHPLEGGRYLLQGGKALVPLADNADYFVVLARHVGDTPRFSLFIVHSDKVTTTPDSCGAPLPVGNVSFDKVELDADARLGGEGQGLVIIQTTVDMMRLPTGAACIGLGRRTLVDGTSVLQRRGMNGRPLKEQQGAVWRIAEALIQLEAALGLLQQAAYRRDSSSARESKGTTMARQLAQDAAEHAATTVADLMGLRGLSMREPWARAYAEIRSLRLETDYLEHGLSVVGQTFLSVVDHEKRGRS
jgi:alkylation response protein AidB-like acyl-CoA dehydrogenase